MPRYIPLEAQPRDETKSPRALRRDGVVPGVLYGRRFEPTKLQFRERVVARVAGQAGFSQFVEVAIDGGERHDALFREIQRDPVTGRILHIDLYRVLADEKLRSTVPLLVIGEAPAVEEGGGVLVQQLDHIDVECFPRDLPESIEVDISHLVDMPSHIAVSDLIVPEGVDVLTDEEAVVVQVSVPRAAAEEEIEAVGEAAEEAAEAEAEAEEGTSGEGAES
ncbi:MAG TPA: 50S ribosomal protein L25 [Chloroflexi bacterium]|jgi:large subunit ribosomal protein L25|nr:50S ribosomal protein L25 [Chloroflexota bacterium]